MKIIAKLDIIGGNWTYSAIYMVIGGATGSVSGLMAVTQLPFSEEKLSIEYDIVAKIIAATSSADASVNDVVWL